MGEETLREGFVHVKRPDAEWLKRVRSGALTYAEVIDLAMGYDSRLAEMIAHSPLPIESTEAAVEKLLIDRPRGYLFPMAS